MTNYFQQSSASAHIDDLVRSAEARRLALVDHPRASGHRIARRRAAFAPRPRLRRAQPA